MVMLNSLEKKHGWDIFNVNWVRSLEDQSQFRAKLLDPGHTQWFKSEVSGESLVKCPCFIFPLWKASLCPFFWYLLIMFNLMNSLLVGFTFTSVSALLPTLAPQTCKQYSLTSHTDSRSKGRCAASGLCGRRPTRHSRGGRAWRTKRWDRTEP